MDNIYMDRIFTKLHLEKIAKHSLPLMFAAAAAFNCNAAIVDHWGMNFETNTTRKTATFTGLVNRTRPQWAEAVNIPATFTDNGTSAFFLCTIKEIVLPEGLKRIQKQAFMESNIENISIPSSVTYIGDTAFANKYALETVKLPASVNTISERSFERYDNIREIATLPAGVYIVRRGTTATKTVIR